MWAESIYRVTYHKSSNPNKILSGAFGEKSLMQIILNRSTAYINIFSKKKMRLWYIKINRNQKTFPSSSLIFMFSFTEGGVWYQSQTKYKAINRGTS